MSDVVESVANYKSGCYSIKLVSNASSLGGGVMEMKKSGAGLDEYRLKQLMTIKENIKKLSPEQALSTCKDIVELLEHSIAIRLEDDPYDLSKALSDLLTKCLFKSRAMGFDLSQFLNRDILERLHGYVAVMDSQSNFVNLNSAYANVIGFDSPDAVQGLSYQDFRSDASEKAGLFAEQDQSVLKKQQPLHFLSYHPYADRDWHLLLGEKHCIKDDQGHPVGVLSQAIDMTNFDLIDVSKFLFESQKKLTGRIMRKPFTYYIAKEDLRYQLTKRELEVLFYFIRGKTSKEIAALLVRAKRTIDFHLDSLKAKFDVYSKSELIEKAIVEGYMSIIPETLFR